MKKNICKLLLILAFFIFISSSYVFATSQIILPSKLSREYVEQELKILRKNGKLKGEQVNSFLLDGGFISFLKSGSAYLEIPIELLMWKHSKDSELMMPNEGASYPSLKREDYWMFEDMYDFSRKNSVLKESVDRAFFEYLSGLKKSEEHNKIASNVAAIFREKIYDGQVLQKFLSFFYYKHRTGSDSPIIQSIGRIVYGSHKILIKDLLSNYLISVPDFETKNKGAQFGIIFNLNQRRYFLKSHQNYPIKRSNKSSGHLLSLSSMSSDIESSGGIKINPLKPVDLKELFAYKVLEKMGFGPHVDFSMSKTLYSGTYIVTEEVNDFVTVGNMLKGGFTKSIGAFNHLTEKTREQNFEVSGNGNEIFIKRLTIFDILARSMLLSDLNSENFGFIVPKRNDTTEVYNFGIVLVDFIKPNPININNFNSEYRMNHPDERNNLISYSRDNPYIYIGIRSSFSDANTFTKYPKDDSLGFFNPNIDFYSQNYEEELMLFRKQKKAFGKLAAREMSLDIIEKTLDSAFEEIKTLAEKEENKTALLIEDNGFEPIQDLKKYREAISVHIKELFDFFNE